MAKKADTTEKAPEKPIMEEMTKGQAIPMHGLAAMMGFDLLGRAPSGKYKIYRKMRGCPTIAIARIAATAPILLANWALETTDDVPDEHKEFVQKQLTPLYPRLIRDMLRGFDYGWQSFEKVWEIRDGKLVYKKLKALLPDQTLVQVDKTTGEFLGLKQKNVILPPTNVFIYSHDAEGTDFYGRSRHENIREHAWHPWTEITKKMRMYATKVAGIIPMIEYPPGVSKTVDGRTESNFKLAQMFLTALGKGNGLAMPNTLAQHATDLMRAGIDLDQLRAWRISFLEGKGAHGRDLTAMVRYFDSLMLRGWLVPERAATEGQFGTKAEAVQHGQLALMMADLDYQEMLRQVNTYVINPLLIYNFGVQAADSVYLARAGLDPAIVFFLRTMVEKVLTAPINTDLFLEYLDIDTILDEVGIPKAAEIVGPDPNKLKDRKNKQQQSKGKEAEDEKLGMTRSLSRVYGSILKELSNGSRDRQS